MRCESNDEHSNHDLDSLNISRNAFVNNDRTERPMHKRIDLLYTMELDTVFRDRTHQTDSSLYQKYWSNTLSDTEQEYEEFMSFISRAHKYVVN